MKIFKLSPVFILFLFLSCARGTIKNPSFESSSPGNKAPVSWQFDSWKQDSTFHGVTGEQQQNGKYSIVIENNILNHAYYSQKLRFPEEKGNYKVSVWIKTQDVREGAGAGITLLEKMVLAGHLKGTEDWKKINLYLIKNEGIRSCKLILTLGHYGSLSRGKAWFDNLTITKAPEEVPGNEISIHLSQIRSPVKSLPLPSKIARNLSIFPFILGVIIAGGTVLFVLFIHKSVKMRISRTEEKLPPDEVKDFPDHEIEEDKKNPDQEIR